MRILNVFCTIPKLILRTLVVIFLSIFNHFSASAQFVNVTPNAMAYNTLGDAFNAINLGTHTGVVNIYVNASITETVSAVLNASGVGSASYSSLTISSQNINGR